MKHFIYYFTGYNIINFITINWISTAYCAINRMVIYYPVDYIIHPLNNWIFDIVVYLTFSVNRDQHLKHQILCSLLHKNNNSCGILTSLPQRILSNRPCS